MEPAVTQPQRRVRRTLVVGDVHGCLDELQDLLEACGFSPDEDRLVLLGDLMDRGPAPVECVRLARWLGADCVLGNHDDKHLRFRRHLERARREPGYTNPMRMGEQREGENARLTDDEIAWLNALPVCLDLGDDWVAVHGGLEPGRSLGQQKRDRVIRLRWVDDGGVFVALGDGLTQPPRSRLWSEAWDGPLHVVYGHAVHSRERPRVDRSPSGFECWGIDTGCCFGGRLTALVLPDKAVVQVAARRKYAELKTPTE